MKILVPKKNFTKKHSLKRETIKKIIIDYPGIRYKELIRMTGVSHGVLSYHLHILEYSKQLKKFRVNNRITRYYPYTTDKNTLKILGFLRRKTTKEIIIYILKNSTCSFHDLVKYLKKSPSTVSWHLNRLKEAGIIIVKKKNAVNIYLLAIDPQSLQELLDRYKITSMDKIVDNYIDILDDYDVL